MAGSVCWVDVGVNLGHGAFVGDVDGVVGRAVGAGVGQMVVTGCSVEGSREGLLLVGRFGGRMVGTVGVHPHCAGGFDGGVLEELRGLAGGVGVGAIGECGLDFYRNFASRGDQLRCFEGQLGLAVELGLPVFLHERDAFEDFVGVLRGFVSGLRGVLVHCFTGSREALECYLGLGCSIGVTGWVCDERRGLGLRGLVGLVPDDRLMLETDAPFLLPRGLGLRPVRSGRNEPCFLGAVGGVVAGLRGVSVGALARVTSGNARRFFGLGVLDDGDGGDGDEDGLDGGVG